ncbi:MAG: PAS domain-containing protein [Candidatus Hadarchaeota archaeon]
MSSISPVLLEEREINVLFVDDEPEIMEQAKMFIGGNKSDINIDATSSPEKAIEKLDKNDYEAIVSDYKMPEMNGLDLLRKVRGEMKMDIVFILLTGRGTEEISLEALNLGADRYLRKGGDPEKRFEVLEETIRGEVEERRLQEELSVKSNLLESMFKNFPASLYVKDKEGRLLVVSDSLMEDYRDDGYEGIIGKTDFDLMPEEDAKKARETEIKVMESEEPVTLTEKTVACDGSELYLHTTKAPVYDEKGNVAGIVGITQDITERKITGEALRKAEREKSWILDATSEMIIHQDLQHRVKWLNKAARERTGEGFESREGKGPKCYEIWPGNDEPCESCPVERALETGERQEEEIEFPDGRIWRVRGNPARDEDGEIVRVVEIAEDITERKRLEEELSRERTFFSGLMETLPASVYFKDKEGRLMRISDYYLKQHGAPEVDSKEEIIGKTDSDLFSEELAECSRKDEKKIMETREPMEEKVEKNVTEDGEEVYLRTLKAPLVDEDDEVMGILGITRDVTEEMEAKEREEFLHSLLRHDIRNKAQIVKGFVHLMEELDLPSEGMEYLSKAKVALNNSLELIDKVRTLREVEYEEAEKVLAIDDRIGSSLQELEPQASEEGIEIHFEKCGCEVLGGPLIEEVFFNLIENSIEHADCNDIIVSGREERGYCVISIEDDGRGVPDEEKDKIFQKGYKGEGSSGSGLGMRLVKSIVESYGGKVEARDSEMGGARFDVYLRSC